MVGKVLGVRLKLRLRLWLGLQLGHWRMVLVCAIAERLLMPLVWLPLLLVVVLLLLLRMEVVAHGGRVGVCLVRLRGDLGMAILRHRLHLGVLGRRRQEVGACLVLLVAHICHRVPGSILLLLVRVLLVLMLMLMLILLMLLRLLELLLLKLRLVLLLMLRISRLRGHLLIAMAVVGLPMARRLLAPIVHGGICHSSRAHCRYDLSLYSLFHPPVFQCRSHLIVTAIIVGSSGLRRAWHEMGSGGKGQRHTAPRVKAGRDRDKLQRTSRLKMPIPGQMRLPGSWKPRPPRAPDGPCRCTCHRRRRRPPCPTSRGSDWDGDLGI